MKTIFILLLILIPTVGSADVINPISNSAFINYSWGKPNALSIASQHGNENASIQSLNIAPSEHNGILKEYVLVSMNGVNGAVFSRKCDTYAVHGDKAFGFSMKGRYLKCNQPNIDTIGEWVNTLIGKIKANANSASELDDRNDSLRIDLVRVFGVKSSARGLNLATGAQGDIFTIKNITVADDLIHIFVNTTSEISLELVLNSTLQLVSAFENGQQLRLLSSGTDGNCDNWSGPKSKSFISKNENIKLILGRERACEYINTTGESCISFIFAAWGEDGTVWIGPSTCKLVEFGGKTLGIETDHEKCNLLNIISSELKINNGRDGVAGFEQRLKSFDDSFAGSGFECITKSTIDLSKLFPGRSDLMQSDLRVRTIKYNGQFLNIVLRTSDPSTVLVVVIGPTISDVNGHVTGVVNEQ